jgi:hypothetical protein
MQAGMNPAVRSEKSLAPKAPAEGEALTPGDRAFTVLRNR